MGVYTAAVQEALRSLFMYAPAAQLPQVYNILGSSRISRSLNPAAELANRTKPHPRPHPDFNQQYCIAPDPNRVKMPARCSP